MAKVCTLLVFFIIISLSRSQAKRAVKTIKSDDGDIIDCVDIYQQPAFNHPLLRNHTIQMAPDSLGNSMIESSNVNFTQPWMEKGSCPEETIPIRRVRKQPFGRKERLLSHGRRLSSAASAQEGAGVSFVDLANPWFGASAEITVWSTQVEPNDFSVTSIRISSGASPGSSLETGYAVHPQLYGDFRPRFFASWTADSGRTTGCFDLVCPGFVQVSNQIPLGSIISPTSTYDGPQYKIAVSILKEGDKWWLANNNVRVGYWPVSIVPDLQVMRIAIWAGWVFNNRNDGQHTTSQMGSGHFADDGVSRAAYIDRGLVTGQEGLKIPIPITPFETNAGCYNVSDVARIDTRGVRLAYGGPGGLNCG